MRIRKHPFILFEVFLAMALLSLAIIPITSYPYKVFEKEKKELLAIELKRLEILVFAKFIKNLPSHISWQDLQQGEINVDLGIENINMKALGQFPYSAQIKITQNSSKDNLCLLTCEVFLEPQLKHHPKHSSMEHYLFINNN